MEEYFLEMLRLFRSDNVGVRSKLSAVYLTLGKEQECYDFIKWYQCYPVNGYDQGNTDLPFLIYEQYNFGYLNKVLTEKVQLVQKHFDILFERIDMHNRRIWRAILEPGRPINQQEPEMIVQNTANEAYAIVKSFLRPWEWTEGAIEYLETRLGKDTQYDAEIQQF
ncbi:hypothetical protein MIR68_005937 [Amoeboaphelidium protococcarum]|nr:hypothetical protein MIR68_005937 [Amoeboaphelidium protococcarum]